MSNTYDLIRQAILDKDSIAAEYDGYHREMSPHVIGLKHASQHVLCYQYAGESSSGLGPPGAARNWRCIVIEKLGDVRLIKGVFHTAPNHSRPQTCVDAIDAEVRF